MWRITIYLMRLADYLKGRKDKRTCNFCNYVAKNEKELKSYTKRIWKLIVHYSWFLMTISSSSFKYLKYDLS